MRFPIPVLLGLAAVDGYASSSPSSAVIPTTDSGVDTADPSPVVLPRSYGVPGIPTDPISPTTSAQGTAVRPSHGYDIPLAASSVVVIPPPYIVSSVQGSARPSSVVYSNPPVASSVVAVPPPSIGSSVQGSAVPSSVVWSSQQTSQAASSQWASSVQAPASPSSVQPPAAPSSIVWSAPPSSQAASSAWVSSVQAPAPPSSAVWSSQPSSQWASSVQAPAPSSSAARSSQPSSEAGSSGVAPPRTASSIAGSSAAPSSGESSVASSSAAASTTKVWSSSGPSFVSGPVLSSGAPASSVGGSFTASSSAAWTTSGGSASPTTAWSSTARGSMTAPGSPVQPSGLSSSAQSSTQGSSVAQSSGGAISSTRPTSVQGSTTPEGVIVIPTGISSSSTLEGIISPPGFLGSNTPSGTNIWPPGSSGSSTPSGTNLWPPGSSGSSTPSGTSLWPPGLSGSSTPSANLPLPIVIGSSSTPPQPVPTSIGCPEECRILDWCKGFCENVKFPRPLNELPPTECLDPANIGWCGLWWHGPPSSTTTSTSSTPLPTSTGCPDECRPSAWCKDYCYGWLFPRPIDEQPPDECLDPKNALWCYPWWFGKKQKHHVDGDPDSHSDSDPNCKEDNCIAACAAQRIASFLIFKRPVCFCVPKKCNKGHDSDSPSDKDSDHDHDSDSDSDSDSDDSSKKRKCKLFGCGCGWMGLPFGPPCPGVSIALTIPCSIFGCNPCIFFGCPPGSGPVDGVVGHDGYCPGPEGCDPCPPEICDLPGCTVPGGCGPKPGPAPTKPPNEPDPEKCDEKMKTTVTDRFVMCTEGFDVSALPSTLRFLGGGTSSTVITSECMPMVDVTRTLCGPAAGYDTTTTLTGTNTLTSDAPACTRAPLSLDDDEGNNNPDEPMNTWTFSSNTTTVASSTANSSSSSASKKSSTSSSKTSSTKSPSSTSSAKPAPSHTPMDRNGHWKVDIAQYMYDDYSETQWDLFDPNGFHAGMHNTRGHDKKKEITDYVQSVNRPWADSMPFGVDMTIIQPHNMDRCRINFEIRKKVTGCDIMKGVECRPYMTTETRTEKEPFRLQTCEDSCHRNGKESPLIATKSDMWCDDLNKADWTEMATGWKRHFSCGWKGFD